MTTLLTVDRTHAGPVVRTANATGAVSVRPVRLPQQPVRPGLSRRPSGPRRLARRGAAGCVVGDVASRQLRPAVRPVRRVTRLTRRGVAALAVLTAAAAGVLVWAAWLSAPQATTTGSGPATVTVQPGDTLWSVATAVAPGTDPRAEVATLQQLNHLHGVQLAVGQVLRTR